jgi:hypothetical protein
MWSADISTLRKWRKERRIAEGEFMAKFILPILAAVRVFFRSRGDAALEVLALR